MVNKKSLGIFLISVFISGLLLSSCTRKQYCFGYKGYPYNGLWKKGKVGKGNQDKKSPGR